MEIAGMANSMNSKWYMEGIDSPSEIHKILAKERQQTLTKPRGSLGVLEDLAIDFSGWQSCETPEVTAIKIAVFAADHGIANENVSAFPQQVTIEMIRNFSTGGAAISVLARQMAAEFVVVNVGTAQECPLLKGVVQVPVGLGTANFTKSEAMTEQQLEQALAVGAGQALEKADLFIGGEMGIGNTSSAAALACALLQLPAMTLTGRGTGIDTPSWQRKQKLINLALEFHADSLNSPLDILRCLGGFEIAALTGSYIRCAQLGTPILVDGFIATAAALLAVRLRPEVLGWMIFAHRSQEPGHRIVLEALDASPLLDFSLRLGEGSGAALAVPLIQSACKLHAEMATFAEASVSQS
jgi:nicotinate-nucleotide--dimethylbenzimidazole phosphoribosyltransferase